MGQFYIEHGIKCESVFRLEKVILIIFDDEAHKGPSIKIITFWEVLFRVFLERVSEFLLCRGRGSKNQSVFIFLDGP